MDKDFSVKIIVYGPADMYDDVKSITNFIRESIHRTFKGNPDYVNDNIVLSDSLCYPALHDEVDECYTKDGRSWEVVYVTTDPDKCDIVGICIAISSTTSFIETNFSDVRSGKVKIGVETNAKSLDTAIDMYNLIRQLNRK